MKSFWPPSKRVIFFVVKISWRQQLISIFVLLWLYLFMSPNLWAKKNNHPQYTYYYVALFWLFLLDIFPLFLRIYPEFFLPSKFHRHLSSPYSFTFSDLWNLEFFCRMSCHCQSLAFLCRAPSLPPRSAPPGGPPPPPPADWWCWSATRNVFLVFFCFLVFFLGFVSIVVSLFFYTHRQTRFRNVLLIFPRIPTIIIFFISPMIVIPSNLFSFCKAFVFRYFFASPA